MRTFLIVLLTALLTLIWAGAAMQEGLIPSNILSGSLDTCTTTTVVKTYEEGECEIPNDGENCETPRWTTVAHGDVVLSFQNPSATLTEGCESKSSVCNNWAYINDNNPYEYEVCELETPLNCDVNGFVFAHGTTEVFYEEWVRISGEIECNSQERTCEDGEASGWDTYIYKSCSIVGETAVFEDTVDQPEAEEEEEEQPLSASSTTTTTTASSNNTTTITYDPDRQPNCPSPRGWRRREPGQVGTAYESASVPFGTTCEPITVVCAYWSIRYGTEDNPWNVVDSSLATICSVSDPAPCSSACGTVQHGNLVTTYKQWLIPHGNGKVCEDVKVASTCNNGSLTPAWGEACSCAVAPPSPCSAPNGQTIAHGSSLTLYKYPKVQALPGDGIDVCERQWRECVNGEFYDRNGNKSTFEFEYTSCEVLEPPAGWGPGGQGVPQE